MTTLQKVIKYLAIALALLLVASIISGLISIAVSIAQAFTDTDDEESTVYDFADQTVSAIDIDVDAAELTILKGDAPRVETSSSRVKVNMVGNTLTVEENEPFINRNDIYTLTITLPDVMLTEADISTGAGKVTVDGLSCDILELDLGAGETVIDGLVVAKSAEINGGAGKIVIDNAIIKSLDFEMGVGDVIISASLSGSNSFDCGVGKLELELFGTKDSYSINADKGVGSFTVDGQEVSDGATIGSGDITVDIDSGVGSVIVTVVQVMDETN